MKKYTLDIPAMYADHHVIEVRKLLQDVAGVKEIYASSAFRVVEVLVDGKTTKNQIKKVLEEAGYMGDIKIDIESSTPVNLRTEELAFYRHTGQYEEGLKSIGFAQGVASATRPLYPCPGMGTVQPKEMVD